EIFPCFHYQTVLITDAKVIYYIGTAIRANGDLRTELRQRQITKTYHWKGYTLQMFGCQNIFKTIRKIKLLCF
ncbi:hypothetical protein, partial [Prevotella sp.]